jgi:hypothetical protein
VNTLAEKAFRLLVLEQGFKGVVNELTLIDIGKEGLKVLVIVVNRFKELKESVDYLHVGLTEALVKFNSSDAALNLLIVGILIFKVVKSEEDALIATEFLENQSSSVLIDLLSIHSLLDDISLCSDLRFLGYYCA